jgi:poly(3-hydroxybutyrate) depolymerase
MMHRGRPVRPEAIRNVALLTVEGELDDITGAGQTQAAHKLCVNIPADMRADYVQPGVGHYGVFNGSRFRAEIAPRMADFILTHNKWDGTRAPNAFAAAATKPAVETTQKPAAKAKPRLATANGVDRRT